MNNSCVVVNQSIHPPIHVLSIRLSFLPFLPPSIFSSSSPIHPSIQPSILPSNQPFIHPPIHSLTHLSIYLNVLMISVDLLYEYTYIYIYIYIYIHSHTHTHTHTSCFSYICLLCLFFPCRVTSSIVNNVPYSLPKPFFPSHVSPCNQPTSPLFSAVSPLTTMQTHFLLNSTANILHSGRRTDR